METLNTKYSLIWTAFRFEAKKRIAKYVVKNTNALIIGNVVLVLNTQATMIEKNILNTHYAKAHKFQITDAQFGLINLTSKEWNFQDSVEEVCKYKTCEMPALAVNNNGKLALIPVTNKQFLGTGALGRKTIWI